MKKLPLISLIVVNLLPIIGVLFFEWDIYSILYLYWFESAVIGFYTIPKIYLSKLLSTNKNTLAHFLQSGEVFPRMLIIVFFILHFGIFMFVHLMFINAIFKPEDFDFTQIVPVIGLLFISHGISFYKNYYLGEEYLRTTADEQTTAVYQRVIVMHMTILLGGLFISILGIQTIALVVLILIKIGFDVSAHIKQHSKLGGYSATDIQSP